MIFELLDSIICFPFNTRLSQKKFDRGKCVKVDHWLTASLEKRWWGAADENCLRIFCNDQARV